MILTETSSNENIKVMEKLKHDHKEEIEGLKKEMENEKNKLQQKIQVLKEKQTEYKKEMDKIKAQNIFINTYKIENERLNRVMEEKKEKDIKKDTEQKKVIADLKDKIKKMNLEKAYNPDKSDEAMETENEQKVQKCNDCQFKTIWKTYMTEHKKTCQKQKNKKK